MNEMIDVNGQPYRVICLLGKGKGGYSYLTEKDGRQVVVKQIHHEPCAYYQFGDKLASELRDYDRLTALGLPLPRLLDVDRAQERLVKEYIPGETMLETAARNEVTEHQLQLMRQMCAVLYPAGLNIDYFPTNFIDHNGVLYYVDYESNTYMEQWDFEHWGIRYWARTPELEAWLKENRP